MNRALMNRILEYFRRKAENRRWRQGVTCLAAVVVFATTYALILPAITMSKPHPALGAEQTAAWSGEELSVRVEAEADAGEGRRLVVLTAEGEGADLSPSYVFDADGICLITDEAGREVALHRSLRQGREGVVDYWFLLDADSAAAFTLSLADQADEARFARLMESVRRSSAGNTGAAGAASGATPSDAEPAEAAGSDAALSTYALAAANIDNIDPVDASPSNADEPGNSRRAVSPAPATASNARRASDSNARTREEAAGASRLSGESGETIEIEEDDDGFVRILDGAVINDLARGEEAEYEDVEITATLKLSAGMGNDYGSAVRDAERNADKRGDAQITFHWKDAVLPRTAGEAPPLSWSENGTHIAVFCDGESGIPEDAVLSVREIDAGSDEYAAFLAKAQGAVTASRSNAERETGIHYARFFDITIQSREGEEITPEEPVKVVMTFDEAVPVRSDDGLRVLHFPEDGEEDVLPEPVRSGTLEGGSLSKKDVGALTFTADAFSVYGVVGTELYGEVVLPGSDASYTVIVTAPAAAKIPEGATLKLTSFSEDSEAYAKAREAVLADRERRGEGADVGAFGLAALDLTILSPEGHEVQPEAPVTVALQIRALPGVEHLNEVRDTLEIQHHRETAGGIVPETVYEGSEERGSRAATAAGEEAEERQEAEEAAGESLELSFAVTSFSTFTISWNNAGGNGVAVHYVDEDGAELTVENSVLPTTLGSNSSSPAHLIYDIEGYAYDHTTRRYYSSGSWGTQDIVPELRRTGNAWRYSTNGSSFTSLSASGTANPDEIYVVYKRKAEITEGGTPALKPVGSGDYPEDPDIRKEIDPKADGTADLSLSITGHTRDREVEKLADVIVVFDVSRSMNFNMSGNSTTTTSQRRITIAKNAVNTLVDNLAEKKNSAGQPLIRMALVPFSTTVGSVTELTPLSESGVSSFKSAVSRLSVVSGLNGGTNWDGALEAANRMEVDPERATFVIFVTDGSPTFRNTRTNITDTDLNRTTNGDISESTYLAYHVFGTGGDDNRGNNYRAAVAQGAAIVGANKNLYSIGISSDVSNLESFNDESGGQGAVVANSVGELTQAFSDIEAAIIAKVGYSDIAMTDGITEMTQTVDKSGLAMADGSFTYWKKGQGEEGYTEWSPASESCGEAVYDSASGAVRWNMGPDFMPEDGVTYKVTWKVWPSQEAYDILAKCRNDPGYYDTLPESRQAQIIRSGDAPDYSYTLLTNEPDAGITYRTATKSGTSVTTEGSEKTLFFNAVDPIGMASDTIRIRKLWENQLDSQSAGGAAIPFTITADGEPFGVVTLGPANWTAEDFSISSGLMTVSADGTQTVYSPGHDFTVTEPEEIASEWELSADTYRVMVINGVTTVLIRTDSGEEADYIIDGRYYRASSSGAELTAENKRISCLKLSKDVVDQNGQNIADGEVFSFAVTVTEAAGEEVWFRVYDSNAQETVMDASIARGPDLIYEENDGFFHGPGGTELTLMLKDGWEYQFINLHTGSSYVIEEALPPAEDGYFFQSAEASATSGGVAADITGRKAEGTIDRPNAEYTVAYVNRLLSVPVWLKKTDENGGLLSGAEFELTKLSGTVYSSVATGITPGGGDTLNPADLGNLPVGSYRLTETLTPDGYVKQTGYIAFQIYQDTDGSIRAELSGDTDPSDAGISAGDDGGYVITAVNTPGQALPDTGGPGTVPYTLGGFVFVILAASMYGFRRKPGERGE